MRGEMAGRLVISLPMTSQQGKIPLRDDQFRDRELGSNAPCCLHESQTQWSCATNGEVRGEGSLAEMAGQSTVDRALQEPKKVV